MILSKSSSFSTQNMDFSIIVPVFNSSKYISDCFDSIFNQDSEINFEVIAIDDKSSDDSLNILYNYASNEPRLKVLSNDVNQRPYKSRAIAASKAIGKYIVHVDIDDYIAKDSLKILKSKICLYDVDIIICNWKMKYGDKETVMYDINNELETNDKNLIQPYMMSMSPSKIVKRELVEKNILKNNRFESNADDLLYCTEILFNSKNFLLIPDILYTNIVHKNSFTSVVSRNAAEFINGRIILLENLIILKNHYGENKNIFSPIMFKIYRQLSSYILIFQIKNNNSSFDITQLTDNLIEFDFINEVNHYISDLKKMNEGLKNTIFIYLKKHGLKDFLHVIKKIILEKININTK